MTARRAALLLLALASAGPARAAEDGGTRSVFARGAGNRALGMGSAFAAVADDASAAMWNPGGLAWASRLELQAGQNSTLGIGASEAYAALAAPDWRWGTVAASFRKFGVAGIERRDDRNVLLDDDLSDSQTEIGFGYGRLVFEHWGLGAVLKLRRHSLAGLSATGFGLDVGVRGRPAAALGYRAAWAQGLSWGLAVANLVEPSLRLDRESVADPAGVRTGIAYAHTFLGSRELVTAVDVERARGSGARLHAGAELRLHPLLALRAGVNEGAMTAGTGLRWRDLALDYAYEENPLEAVHRIGLAYAFGPTVAERRETAIRAEEETAQQRIAEAFQRRQEEQIASLLARAEERRAEGRHDEALDLIGTVTTLDPQHRPARALEARCLREKAAELERAGEFADAAIAFGRVLAIEPGDSAAVAGQLRCQAESDLRAARSADLRRQFAAAMDAFGADDLAAARRGFRGVLTADPDDEDASLMLRRTEQAIARRTQSLIKQAGRAIQANLLAEASALLDQAGALDPGAEGLAQAGAALARARQRAAESSRAASDAARAPAPAATEPPRLSPQKKREVEMLYRRGLDAMKDRRSDDALRYWELVWSADPGYQKVAEYLKREYLMRGMEAYAAGKLDEAVAHWERALQVDPSDARARGYLARAQQQLARTREILGGGR